MDSMNTNINNLSDALDKLPERIAIMLAPMLAEVFETSTSKVIDKVGKTSRTSSKDKKLSNVVGVDFNKRIEESTKKMIENVNSSTRMIKAINDPKIKEAIQSLNFSARGLTQATNNAQKSQRKMQSDIQNLLLRTPKATGGISNVFYKAMKGPIPVSNYGAGISKKAEEEKQLSMLRAQGMMPHPYFQGYNNKPMNLPMPGLKPLKGNDSIWHNLDLLSKGAVPLAWKDNKGVELLGQILVATKGSLKLEKEENKIWSKLWKDSLKSGINSGLGAASAAIAPLAGSLATMAGFTALQSLVKMSGNNPIVRQGALYAMVLSPVIATALGSILPNIMGHVIGGALEKSFQNPAAGRLLLKGAGKFALAGAGIGMGAYEGANAYSSFKSGNTGVAIGDTISSIAGFVGAFLPGWFKLVLLIPLLWEAAKKFLHLEDKEKESPMDRWLKDLGVGTGKASKASGSGKSVLDKTLDYLMPSKKENLKNTMEVIKDFQSKVGGTANISSIMGGKHSPFSGHYQGKKFDVGLYGKSNQERIKEYKALIGTAGVENLGFETPDRKKYDAFKKQLIKENIDVSKLKPYYWTKESSGEHFDVSTGKKPIQEKDMLKLSNKPMYELPSSNNNAVYTSNLPSAEQIVKQTTSTTANRINSNDPGKRKSSSSTVLNSLVHTQH